MEDANEAGSPGLQGSSQSTSVQAAKRTRYTPIACDECKRRKIKCDGQTPCRRCSRHPTNCVYTRRGNNVASRQEIEWKRMNEKISNLQEQISLLEANVAAGVPLRQQQQQQGPATPVSTSLLDQTNLFPISSRQTNGSDSILRRRSRPAQHPQYLGPTSSAFSFGVARNSLQEMGIRPGADSTESAIRSYSTTPARSPLPSDDMLYARDPLLSIPQNEAIRLVETYEEESGTVYPFIDIKLVLNAAKQVYYSGIPNRGASAVRRSGDGNILSGGILDILKLVIAIALVVEGHGPTTLSQRLLDSVESGFDARLCGPSVDILEIQAWTLMSILQFHCDEEALAWRTIGLAARAAIELGIHRRDTYFSKFSDPRQRLWANKLFWCIYVLDRRWSFGTGLPFALHDDDIDPDLPEQSDSDSSLLKIMIAYGQLGSKVWKATSNLTASVNAETLAFLDFQVRQWQDSITPDLKLQRHSEDILEGCSRTKNRLRVLLYLRANQMRLLILRRTLLSPTTIADDIPGAQKAVNIAKDTIYVLDRVNRSSDIYSTQQTSFNYFLVSALAVMLLAVCHATAKFNDSCREEFYLALDLIRGFSGKSHVARRLWRTVKHLKVVGPKLGVFPTQEQRGGRPNNNSREGNMSHQVPRSGHGAPASEYGFDFDYSASLPFDPEISPVYSFPLDGNQLSDELGGLFESFEPGYAQLPVPNPGIHGNPDFYNYETTDVLSRSLLDLL